MIPSPWTFYADVISAEEAECLSTCLPSVVRGERSAVFALKVPPAGIPSQIDPRG